MPKWECYIGALDLSDYVRRIEIVESKIGRLFCSKVLLKNKAKLALDMEAVKLAGKKGAVYLRAGRKIQVFKEAELLFVTGGEIQIRRASPWYRMIGNIEFPPMTVWANFATVAAEAARNVRNLGEALVIPQGVWRNEEANRGYFATGIDPGLEGADVTFFQHYNARWEEARLVPPEDVEGLDDAGD